MVRESYRPISAPIARLLRAEEVAEILQLSVGAVYAHARLKQIPSVRIGRSVRFHPAAIETWLAQTQEESLRIKAREDTR